MMKKILLLAILCLTFILGGCTSNNKSDEEVMNANISEEKTLENVTENQTDYNFPMIHEHELQLLYEYRKEVILRDRAKGNFVTEEEEEIIKSKYGYPTSGDSSIFTPLGLPSSDYLCYPVLYQDENGEVVMIACESDGDVIIYDSYKYLGNIHCDKSEFDEIHCDLDYLIEFDSDIGKINIWRFGVLKDTYELGENTVYAGESFFEGFIFRNGSDVYAISYDDDEFKLFPIAHNVKEVILTDYILNKECWSQPLLFMEDNTIKVYVGKTQEIEDKDDSKFLREIEFEGGYNLK